MWVFHNKKSGEFEVRTWVSHEDSENGRGYVRVIGQFGNAPDAHRFCRWGITK